ncbi:winged helix-turn-helix transcriptional regulator [Ensifer sp. MJa1]|uniref:winged helix-turn-helix transcriptional regulator n=1 Tax=Ensifer sp. MJa1 TaxID=2919888 RepID=UPI003009F8F3
MLLRQSVLAGIADGSVTLAFRRWTRPTVRAGGTLLTAMGVLAIDAVDEIEESAVTDDEAEQAGFADRAALLKELALRPEGRCYRIALRRIGDDPRLTLRDAATLSDRERTEIHRKLDAFDRSTGMAWTHPVLRLIADHDRTTAAELSAAVGMDKLKLKARIRKLKELGLTESLSVGYRLSARGRSYLDGN